MTISVRTRIAAVGLVVGLLSGAALLSGTRGSTAPNFWDQLTFGAGTVEVEYYPSLSHAASSADLIVTGNVESIHLGRVWGDPSNAENQAASVLINLRVSEVIRGTLPDAGSPLVTVERQILGYTSEHLRDALTRDGILIAGELASIPDSEALLLLRILRDQGSEIIAATREPVGGVSYRLVNSQGLITRGEDGLASMPLSVSPDHQATTDHHHDSAVSDLPEVLFAETVTGSSFDAMLEIVREAG